MVDAWARPAPGVLSGNTRLLGDWDECVSAGGRVCVAMLSLGSLGDVPRRLLDAATAHRTALERPDTKANFFAPRFALWQWAACVPHVCSAADAGRLVGAALGASNQLRVRVREEDCSDAAPQPWDLSSATALAAWVVLFALSTAASATVAVRNLRAKHSPTAAPSAAWAALSVQSGWRQLRAPQGSVPCLDGLRVFSTLWVVAFHKMVLWAQGPAANKAAIAEYVQDIAALPLVNGIHSVDTFLVISGFLRCKNMLKELDEGTFSYMHSFLQRIFRLLPAYAAVVALYATLLERVGSGPLWRQTVAAEVNNCRRHGYLNLLFVNNYVGSDELCLAQSWYLSVDMQLFAASPLLVRALHSWRRLGPALLAGSLLLATLLPAATLLLLCRCPALVGLATSDEAVLEYARYIYFPTHNRMSPYLIGITLAYVMHRGFCITLGKVATAACWVVSLLTLAAVVLGPQRLLALGYQADTVHARTEAALYASLHSLAWGLAIAWLIFACETGHARGVATVLGNPALRSWSRLCYGVYLTHLSFLLVMAGSARTAPYLDKVNFIHGLLGDVVASSAAAAVLYLLLEAPGAWAGRSLLRRLCPRRPPHAPDIQQQHNPDPRL